MKIWLLRITFRFALKGHYSFTSCFSFVLEIVLLLTDIHSYSCCFFSPVSQHTPISAFVLFVLQFYAKFSIKKAPKCECVYVCEKDLFCDRRIFFKLYVYDFMFMLKQQNRLFSFISPVFCCAFLYANQYRPINIHHHHHHKRAPVNLGHVLLPLSNITTNYPTMTARARVRCTYPFYPS